MGLGDQLRNKLDLPDVSGGSVEVSGSKGSVEVEVVELDGLGAKIDRVRVRVPRPTDLPSQAEQISERVRGLGERLVPVEVDERLGGGVLRSRPEEMRGGYYEVGLDGSGATVERYGLGDDGVREKQPFTVTREQLGRLVDDLEDGLSELKDQKSDMKTTK